MSKNEAHGKILDIAKEKHPGIFDFAAKHGPIEIPKQREKTLFLFLCRTIIGQQLSKIVYRKIWDRLLDRISESNKSCEEYLTIENKDEIRGCGISNSKFNSLLELKKAFTIEPQYEAKVRPLKNDLAMREMTKIWGVGEWTAQMALLFYFRREDVWPKTDGSIMRGITKMTGEKALDHRQFELYRPFRSYLALYVWKFLDG